MVTDDNINFLEQSFDYWLKIGDKNRRGINQYQRGKFVMYFDEKNLFKKCLKNYSRSLSETIMLYAFLVYLLNRENISDENFRRRIRVVNNLVNISAGTELSDSESRQGGNRLPAILKQVDSIICNGKILNLERQLNFNLYQLQEERDKLEWTTQNPALAETLFELEDHYLLYGQIAILGLKNYRYFKRFISLFNCDYDKINCALATFGYYFQNLKGRYQLGTQKPASWQNLFHKNSTNKGFKDTQERRLKKIFPINSLMILSLIIWTNVNATKILSEDIII